MPNFAIRLPASVRAQVLLWLWTSHHYAVHAVEGRQRVCLSVIALACTTFIATRALRRWVPRLRYLAIIRAPYDHDNLSNVQAARCKDDVMVVGILELLRRLAQAAHDRLIDGGGSRRHPK
ncbi:hypothetical protein K437DRAFT_189393 [Tilletiaria anomala UBC 951]|uniref:Uncharacterized protein n=1 Tax=Tilletiaria anomala (strain ATCC 24038 / CBS 436.72 / UBC 951) TaxID=1037660 RepID=A0A066VFD9_TILAU|nr:uncharacterized protein K437DRAFT_189393 [Tilletiaria anomala UBC 951]KDN40437.1 hypothetical protein K437DRAFT_189393 [Tilletiaria anomala UBC 951]